MSHQLKAAIIGSGLIARVHANAVRASGHQLYAVASSSRESAQRFANEFVIPNVFDSWIALLEDPEIDVVHICTPNELHAEIGIAAARANKHVVCEKPISVSVPEAIALQDAVVEGGTGFAVPFAYRFYPLVREIRSRVRDGEAGKLHLMHGNYLQDWLADSDSTNWRVDSVAGGESRAFADIGSHWCDLMEFITGDRITRLVANTAKAFDTRGGKAVATEDISTVLFETQGGASGTLTVSQVSLGRKNQLLIEVDGAKASYTFNQESPDTLLIGGKLANQVIFSGHDTLQNQDSKRLATVPSGHPQGYQDAFNAFVSDAYDGFQGVHFDGVPGIADGVRSATLIEAVLTSAAEKRWVDVPVFQSGVPAEALIS